MFIHISKHTAKCLQVTSLPTGSELFLSHSAFSHNAWNRPHAAEAADILKAKIPAKTIADISPIKL